MPAAVASRNQRRAPFEDQLALSRDLIALLWQHRLWWALPIVVALLLLSVLLVPSATPLGPLIYPLF